MSRVEEKLEDEMKKFLDENEIPYMEYPAIFRHSRIMTDKEKFMMGFIFDLAQGGPIPILDEYLAHMCRCSKKEVSNSLSKLVRINYLTKIPGKEGPWPYFAITDENLENIVKKEKGIVERMLKEEEAIKKARRLGRKYSEENSLNAEYRGKKHGR